MPLPWRCAPLIKAVAFQAVVKKLPKLPKNAFFGVVVLCSAHKGVACKVQMLSSSMM
jgi:hypothetical protein